MILHDATELDFSNHASVAENLGQIGNGNHRGYIAQNSLAVDSNTGRVLGLTNLWLKGTATLPKDWKLIDVCDQGSDTFEFIEHEVKSGRRFVLRTAYDRGILIGHGKPAQSKASNLRTYARTLPIAGTWTLSVTSRTTTKRPKRTGKKKTVKRIARDANMAVSFAAVQIKPPQTRNGQHGNTPMKVWVVRIWEIDPPQGQERLEWFLITNEVVASFAAAYTVVGWSEKRWIVEEYHKGMKTGCQIESPQFTCEKRLQPAIALISVVTLTLLEMRDASRRADAKTRPAREIISEDYVSVLCAWRHGKLKRDWTIHDFCYALARLGGHQNRKGDHRPGWITIWRGWNDLQAMVAGAEAMKRLQKCG